MVLQIAFCMCSILVNKVSEVAAHWDHFLTHMQHMSHGKQILCCVRVTHVDTGGGCSNIADGDGCATAAAEN